jgi:hypothetical protein
MALAREKIIPIERPPLIGEASAKFSGRECHVFSAADPYGRIFGILDRSRYFVFQVAPQLYSWGWVYSVPEPLLLKETGSAGNRTRTSRSVVKTLNTRPQKSMYKLNRRRNMKREVKYSCPTMLLVRQRVRKLTSRSSTLQAYIEHNYLWYARTNTVDDTINWAYIEHMPSSDVLVSHSRNSSPLLGSKATSSNDLTQISH